MADVTLTMRAVYDKNDRTLIHQADPYEYTLTAGAGVISGVMTATFASAVSIPLGDGTAYMALVQNLNATNFVELGYDDTGFVDVMDIKPGAFVLVNLSGILAVPQVKADTANCLISYTIFSAPA